MSDEKKRTSFSEQIKIITDLMENNSELLDARFQLFVNNDKRQLLIFKQPNGTITKRWQVDKNVVDKETETNIEDQQRFHDRTEQIEQDAMILRELRDQLQRGEIEIIEKENERR